MSLYTLPVRISNCYFITWQLASHGKQQVFVKAEGYVYTIFALYWSGRMTEFADPNTQ